MAQGLDMTRVPSPVRRGLLVMLGAGLAGVAGLFLWTRWRSNPGRPDPLHMNLPGEGSIFEPRRDAVYEAYQRKRRASDIQD
jgi:hypothetical protein